MKLIADIDTGIDDALTLFYLAHAQRQGQVELLGVTTIGGNVHVEQTTRNTLKVLELLELDTPVARGVDKPLLAPLNPAPFVHGDDGLGNTHLDSPGRSVIPEAADEFLLRLSREHEGELVLLTTAPLSNIAVALLRDPDLAKRLKKVVVMGGAVFTGNVSPVAEANIANDPEAAQIVFASGADLTMIGLDVTHEVYLEEPDLAPLEALDNERSAFLLKIIRFMVDAYGKLTDWPRCVLHDPLAAGVVLHPDLVRTESRHIAVEVRGELTRGMTVVDRRGRESLGEGIVQVALEVDAPRFKSAMLESLLAWAQAE